MLKSNHKQQRTIKEASSCTGVGLHTGVESKITFKPAPENYGIRFKRTDIKGSPAIKADIDHVVDISRGTTIEQNGVRIHTVEHALAAVSGLRIDNILIELTSKETPVMDGSAKDFVEALHSSGQITQDENRRVLPIRNAVTYSDTVKEIDIHVIPSNRFRVTFMVGTIKEASSCTGVGLHTGVESKITFKPAPENYGIRFKRTDIKGSPAIKADIDHVVDISRGTTIEQNGVRIHTVEHALAAVSGLRIDNILIELTSKETPVMDGSAKDFVEALHSSGQITQDENRRVLPIRNAVTYSDTVKEIDIHVIPSNRFRVTFMVDYPLPQLGTQYEAIYNMEEDFAKEVAPARTFCFMSEVEMLKEQGLIKGGTLENAVVIIDKEIVPDEIDHLRTLFNIEETIISGANGILNDKVLRYRNEPVRHKTLDLIGDLALLGVPIKGHVTAARSGHASNVEFVKMIRQEYADYFKENKI